MKVYLDNAATTRIDEAVIEEMKEVMREEYGNPSSIHELGRKARTRIEKVRKQIASYLDVSPGEIFFTSGGTEADNMAISCVIQDRGVNHIITSRIEHHAVLHTAQRMEELGSVKLDYVKLNNDGSVDYSDLEDKLQSRNKSDKTMVCLMHANNEIGNLLDLEKVGQICEIYSALFMSDTVQTIGHLPIHPKKYKLDFLSASAHKFHGPKGIGFIYVNNDVKIKPFIFGGSQERNMRGGTENIYGIAGMGKALELCYNDLDQQKEEIGGLKNYLVNKLKERIEGIQFNGESEKEDSLFTVLSISLPPSDKGEMLLFNLDIAGICASGGSACSSGSDIGSHVLQELNTNPNRPSLRLSLGKFNTKEEIDYTVDKLSEMI